jgi:hypothetical protein
MIYPSAGKALSFKAYSYTIAAMGGLMAIILVLGNYPAFIEKYYSGGLYRLIGSLWHFLLGWVHLSVGDIFYAAIIACLIKSLLNLIANLVRKQWKQLLVDFLKLVIGLQIFICGFYLLWGLNYSRPPAAEIFQLPDSSYTTAQLQSITHLLIDSANKQRYLLTKANLHSSNRTVFISAVEAVKGLKALHVAFQSYSPSAKPSLFTPVLNYMGTAGYFNPFSSEAQVNYSMPLVNKPLTACHEMAHQMGFAREDEANFIGFLAGINSADRLLRYSAYYLATQEFMQQVYLRDTVAFHQLKSQLSTPVKSDMKVERLYWQHYQSRLSYFLSIFYDGFLKANKQPEGMRTYNRMVNLTMAYYKKGKSRINPTTNGLP